MIFSCPYSFFLRNSTTFSVGIQTYILAGVALMLHVHPLLCLLNLSSFAPNLLLHTPSKSVTNTSS